MTPGKIVAVVLGAFAGLLALGLLLGGAALLWLSAFGQDDDGFFTSSDHRFAQDSYAIASRDIDIVDLDWFLSSDRFGKISIEAQSNTGADVFVGIADSDMLAEYLDGVGYHEVDDIDFSPFDVTYTAVAGGAPGLPGEETFWESAVGGPGRQRLEWSLESGTWSVIVMNADASPGVDADIELGARIPFVFGAGVLLLAAGTLAAIAGGVLLYFGLRTTGDDEAGGGPSPGRGHAFDAAEEQIVEVDAPADGGGSWLDPPAPPARDG